MSRLRWRSIGVVGEPGAAARLVRARELRSPRSARRAAWWLPDQGLRLGLDLQGGIHWVIEPGSGAVAIAHELDVCADSRSRQLDGEEDHGERGSSSRASSSGRRGGRPRRSGRPRPRCGTTRSLRAVDADGERLALRAHREWRDRGARARHAAGARGAAPAHRRPDPGIPESVVTRQGDDRVLVQIPGGQIDRGGARHLLQQDRLPRVQDRARRGRQTEELLRQAARGGLPPEAPRSSSRRRRRPSASSRAYLVPQTADITGDYLTDARVGFDTALRAGIVDFTCQPEGGDDLRQAHREEHRQAPRDHPRRAGLQRAGDPDRGSRAAA